MLQHLLVKPAVAVIAMAGAVLQQLEDCGHIKEIVVAEGPIVEIQGPSSLHMGFSGTFTLVRQSLGRGEPCPERAVFTFENRTGAAATVDVPIAAGATETVNGVCVVKQVSTTHAWPTSEAFTADVYVELSAGVVHRAQGLMQVAVVSPAGGTTTTPTTTTTTTPTTPPPVPNPELAFRAPSPAAGAARPQALATGMLDADGSVDLATVEDGGTGADQLETWTSPEDMTEKDTVSLGVNRDPKGLAIGDLDNDGVGDIVVANQSTINLQVVPGSLPGGGYSPGAPMDVALPGSPHPQSPLDVRIRDVDGDSFRDLIVLDEDSQVAVLLNASTGIGSFAFDPPIWTPTGTAGTDFNNAFEVADLNADGHPDIGLNRESFPPPPATPSADVLALLGQSNGTFGTPQTIAPAGEFNQGIHVFDADQDGKRDVVFTDPYENRISFARNTTADGATTVSFEPKANLATNKFPNAVTSGDFNGDGRLDLATTSSDDKNVGVLRRLDSTWDVGHVFGTFDSPRDVVAADFDRDGRSDLAVADFGAPAPGATTGTVFVLLAKDPSRRRAVPSEYRQADAAIAAKKKPKAATVVVSGTGAMAVLDYGKASYGPNGSGILQGVKVTGKLGGKIVTIPRAAKKYKAPLKSILKASFYGVVDAIRYVAPPLNPVFLSGVLVARGQKDKKLKVCLGVKPAQVKGVAVNQASLLWGSGKLAKVRLSTNYRPLTIDAQPAGTPAAPKEQRITVKAGSKRRMPAKCKAAFKGLK
jgi:hypothetical protein